MACSTTIHCQALYKYLCVCSSQRHVTSQFQFTTFCTQRHTYGCQGIKLNHQSSLIGRVGVSPPSHFAGADFYIYISIYVIQRYGILVPVGPCATGKCKAGSITSGYLVKRGKIWTSRCFTSKPWLVCCDSRFGLPLSLTSSTLRAQLPFAASLHAARAS